MSQKRVWPKINYEIHLVTFYLKLRVVDRRGQNHRLFLFDKDDIIRRSFDHLPCLVDVVEQLRRDRRQPITVLLHRCGYTIELMRLPGVILKYHISINIIISFCLIIDLNLHLAKSIANHICDVFL